MKNQEIPFEESTFISWRENEKWYGENMEFFKTSRKKLRRTAKSCREASKNISAFLLDSGGIFFTRTLRVENMSGIRKDLDIIARLCEEAASGKRGRPPDLALHFLIKSKYTEFQEKYPGQRGYWRDARYKDYRGRFVEQMEETLRRLGYPAQSKDSLGVAIKRTLG